MVYRESDKLKFQKFRMLHNQLEFQLIMEVI